MSLTYSTMSKTITQRTDLSEVSSRDLIDLFREIGAKLEIWERFAREPEAVKRAEEIINEQFAYFSDVARDRIK